MKADIGPDVFMSEIYQLCDELSDLDEVVSTERVTTIIFGAMQAEKHPIIEIQVIRYPDLSLERVDV